MEKFMIEVFEKAKKDSASKSRDAVVKHLQRKIDDLLTHLGGQAMSTKTNERYY